ncbi:MAG: PrsW family intramembrane metalloprotease [Ruminococcaceae bacterium]|nr:PrsW family intramembrane metalloprotease [Oscillospiraceae bacterium]
MGINDILLVCAALFPAIALCIYVFKKDRVEKEPIGLLISLAFLGCVICFPAAEIEGVAFDLIKKAFTPYAVEQDGVKYLTGVAFKMYNASKYFVGVALVEEGLKFLVLILMTRKNKNFNSLFDGLIYAVFVSLGFAALENVLYVVKNGWMNAFVRAVMSVPGHMFFAVLMGYYYSMWHMYEKAKRKERALKRDGLLSPDAKEFSGRRHLVLSLLVPILAHGLYDYCCTDGTVLATIGLYAFLLFLYVHCFGRIRKMSKDDMLDVTYSNLLVLKKHPHLAEKIKEKY